MDATSRLRLRAVQAPLAARAAATRRAAAAVAPLPSMPDAGPRPFTSAVEEAALERRRVRPEDA